MRKGTFLVVGDWGYDYGCHGNVASVTCQQTVAHLMNVTFADLGDVSFIINVGDSFYPHGVTSKADPQWTTKWSNIFGPQLLSVPWYSVYGNHDLQHDPCACSQDPMVCAQVNGDLMDLSFFYMPSHSWHKEHPEFDLEVIALDLNHYMDGWNHSATSTQLAFTDCQYTPCPKVCLENMKARAAQALKLFHERIAKSTMKTLLVFSHYPTDYFYSEPAFLAALRDNSKHNIIYFGGHRHSTDQTSTLSIHPNENWLVGGGGGWGCDGPEQGFVVGEISAAPGSAVKTHAILVPSESCCPAHQQSIWKGKGCEWSGCETNCAKTDEQSCLCRELNPLGPCAKCPNSTVTGMMCTGISCSV